MSAAGPMTSLAVGRARFWRDVRAGGIVGVTTLINACAYAALAAYAGASLPPLLPTILASLLVATAVVSVVLARWYSLPSAMGGPAGNAAAVVAAALAVVAGDTGQVTRWADVAVLLALTALLPGVVMIGLAAARLGQAIRYFPYPVVAGFLAGTGWLILVGAVRIAPSPAPLAVACLCLIGLRFVFARWKSPRAFPLAVAASIAAVWIGLLIVRVPADVARADGWLFARLPAALPTVLTPAELGAAHWGVIANAWGALAWVVIVVVAVSMLNGALLELETGVDERVDRDLFVMGGANVLVALAGGFGSQVVLPTSLAAHKLAPGSRVLGYVVAAIALAGTLASVVFLPYLPRPVFAAIIAFYGLRFIEQYVRDASRAMTRTETAIMLAMLAATAFLGLKTALAMGLVLACVAFVSAASTFPVVRRQTTLRNARSRVERTSSERIILDAGGDAVAIIRLQGHLFFGSAAKIDTTLRPLVDHPRHATIVLDLTLVASIDVSAALGFAKLARRAKIRGVELSFAGVTPAIERELRSNGAIALEQRVFATLDAALETHEDRLLLAGPARSETTAVDSAEVTVAPGFAAALRPFVETLVFDDGERIFADGDEADAMYILVAGRLAVEREGIRLRTLQPGTLVGEMGFFTELPRSADVVVLGGATLERLTRDGFARLEREAPALLAALQRIIVTLQADRLRSANAETLALHV